MDSGRKVAVIGAAGFVGRELLRALGESGTRATAVIRGDAEISLGAVPHDVCSDATQLEPGSFDTVINLAYPTSGPTSRHLTQTADLLRTIGALLKGGGHLIHASTLAVFGPALDRRVRLGPVQRLRDTSYVESKIGAEHLAVHYQRERSWRVDIVRLGNVVGHGSSTWGMPLVQRLVTGRPVGVAGRVSGFSNATDVGNVVSYFRLLLESPTPGAGVRYHHLAEFSHVRWSEWITSLASAVHVDPVYARPDVLASPRAREEVSAVFRTLKPRHLHRAIAGERILGSWMRSVLRRVPRRAIEGAKGSEIVFAAPPRVGRDEQAFLAIMCVQQEFKPEVRLDWSPPVSTAESVDRLTAWLLRDWQWSESTR